MTLAMQATSLLITLSANGASIAEADWSLRAFIPNSLVRQGEVRVVETSESVVVQTLLYTRFPDRVLSTICAKEEKSWPPGSACHEDAKEYCRVLKSLPRESRDAGRAGAFRWMIEFIADTGGARVEISEITTMGPRDGLRLERIRTLPVLAVSEPYVRSNMVLILSDRFDSATEAVPDVQRIRRRLTGAE